MIMTEQEKRAQDLYKMGIPNGVIVKRLVEEYKMSEKDAIITTDRAQGYAWS